MLFRSAVDRDQFSEERAEPGGEHGLDRGDCKIHEAGAPFRRFEAMRDDKTMAAAILNPPFAIHARRAGLKDMGAVVDTIGPYLGTVPYVLRAWASANAATLVTYLQACIEGLRFVLHPANRNAAIKLAAERLNLPEDIAAELLTTAADPVSGLTKDAAFDIEGFKTVLKLRARFEGKTALPPDRYIDRTYRDRAIQP